MVYSIAQAWPPNEREVWPAKVCLSTGDEFRFSILDYIGSGAEPFYILQGTACQTGTGAGSFSQEEWVMNDLSVGCGWVPRHISRREWVMAGIVGQVEFQKRLQGNVIPDPPNSNFHHSLRQCLHHFHQCAPSMRTYLRGINKKQENPAYMLSTGLQEKKSGLETYNTNISLVLQKHALNSFVTTPTQIDHR